MDETLVQSVDTPLCAFSKFLADRMGLHFPAKRWPELNKALVAVARDLRCNDTEACVEKLMRGPLTRDAIEILASHLTVGETYFYREKEGLDVLEMQILPQLIASRRRDGTRRIKIWSAGCCSGEEPYTIAILLCRLIADIEDWTINILGTDINPRFLKKARKGVYTEWSFRNAPPWLKDAYFRRVAADCLEIRPSIKPLVSFSYHNLADETLPAQWNEHRDLDLIFCRNVLMYFQPVQAKRVIAKFHRSLIDGGWLLVSPAEVSNPLFKGFQPVRFANALLYRKSGQEAGFAASTEPLVRMTASTDDVGTLRLLPEAATPSLLISPPQEFLRSSVPLAEAVPPHHHQFGESTTASRNPLENTDRAEADTLVLTARTEADQGNLDEALSRCDQAIHDDRLNVTAHYLRANILMEQGRLDEAVASLQRVLYLESKFVLAHFTLGNILKRQGKAQAASKHFANALELLESLDPASLVPESDGLTAGWMSELLQAYKESAT